MRKTGATIERDFKGGLITEATGLNYPNNACVEASNCEFDILGRVSRRFGFDFEAGYTSQTISKTLSAISDYHWKNATGDGLISFAVVQIGQTLYFYDTTNNIALSQGYKTSTVDLTGFSSLGAPDPRINMCQYSDGFGKLFVVHPNLNPFYVTYNSSTDVFTATAITLVVRDFEGCDDGLEAATRPTSTVAGMTKEHHYNLLNQGWDESLLATWDAASGNMPSNADVWWSFKDTSGAFSYANVANTSSGNTLAPKGHFLITVNSKNRTGASGVTGFPVETTGFQNPESTAFFAGRVWYSGIRYNKHNSNIYFSQIIERDTQLGLCYQANDPTAEDLFSLLPSDGGVIVIAEAGTIFKLVPMKNTLVVFASRGIWAITGNTGIGFTASDYTISKLSNTKCTAATSFVEVNGEPIFWTTEGIFTVKAGQNQSGQTVLQVSSLSLSTIQTFYNEIPYLNKSYAKGVFNPLNNRVIWLYRSTGSRTIEDNFEYDSMLVYNVLTNSFSPWTVANSAVKIHGIYMIDAVGAQTIEYNVVDGAGLDVVDASGNLVVAFLQSTTTVVPSFKFLVSYPSGANTKFTMADNNDTSYLDWTSFETAGLEYVSTFTTGYRLHGEAQRRFQPNISFFYNEGNGRYDVQGIWDYAINGDTGKFTNKQRLVYEDSSYSNLHKRIRIRGNGRTLQYKITSVSGQPFKIVGWSTFETSNTTP